MQYIIDSYIFLGNGMYKKICLGLLPLLLSSCFHYGSRILPPDRMSYNKSLQFSDNQQQLLNLVRLRYTDTPYFLSVNNVVSQYSYARTGSLSFGNNPYFSPSSLVSVGSANATLSEMPTVTYTPLQGTEYVTRLLTPIDLRVAYMLLRSGWGVNQVFRLIFQRLGPLNNGVLASRAISSHLPRYKEFHEVGKALRTIQYSDNLILDMVVEEKRYAIKMTIKNYSKLTQRERHAVAKLGITRAEPYVLVVSKPSDKPHEVYAQTRTVLGLFNYLSKGMDVPAEDVANGSIHMTKTPDGHYFDWRKLTRGELRIRFSNKKPCNTSLYVKYRGHWFYIAENDYNSKETLDLLAEIRGIYQGEVKSILPVFTVS